MIRHTISERMFAVGLSTAAGFLDAVGFLQLGGYFVSFMSGNTTRLGAGVAGRLADAGMAVALIGIFVSGVVIGSLIGRLVPRYRRSAILAGVAAGAIAAAVLAGVLPTAALLLIAFAMGAMNTVFERDGEVTIGLTYMTGALVKFGQRLAAALAGGRSTGWGWYALLWAGLAIGASAGAAAYGILGLGALWIGGLCLALLAALSVPVFGP